MVRRDPRVLGQRQTRWTLGAIRERCARWLDIGSDSGLYRLLRRLGITYKRGRSYVHSPDPDYHEKRSYIADKRQEAARAGQETIFLYQDECTYYRQPTLAKGYEAQGSGVQPRAYLGHSGEATSRITGALDAHTGNVVYSQADKMGTDGLIRFYRKVCRAYSEADRVYLVQDNWPVHFHADLIGKLQKQRWPWPMRVPSNWPDVPTGPQVKDPMPIQLLCLPTYASWLNPIEKLWRWLKQEVIHLHRLAAEFDRLKGQVGAFLDRFAGGSKKLLRYTGLLPE